MRRIYLDTIGLLALWNARDQWHERASSAFAGLVASGADFCTSEFVLLECGNAAARLPFRGDVVELREHLRSDKKLIQPSEAEVADAWVAYARGEAGDAGIVDHISFVIMRSLGLREAFTNDRHFRAAGFETLF